MIGHVPSECDLTQSCCRVELTLSDPRSVRVSRLRRRCIMRFRRRASLVEAFRFDGSEAAFRAALAIPRSTPLEAGRRGRRADLRRRLAPYGKGSGSRAMRRPTSSGSTITGPSTPITRWWPDRLHSPRRLNPALPLRPPAAAAPVARWRTRNGRGGVEHRDGGQGHAPSRVAVIEPRGRNEAKRHGEPRAEPSQRARPVARMARSGGAA